MNKTIAAYAGEGAGLAWGWGWGWGVPLLVLAVLTLLQRGGKVRLRLGLGVRGRAQCAGYEAWPEPEPEAVGELGAEPVFRPFKWGRYHLNMGIRALDRRDWLHMYASYPSYIALREARHAAMGAACVRTLPGHEGAALEAARLIATFLARRYPHIISVHPAPRADGHNVTRVSRAPLPGLPAKTWSLTDHDAHDAMRVAGELVPDDLAILAPEAEGQGEGEGGQHRFVAGSICTAGFWRLEDKLGLSLADIHLSGNVPGYAEKLQHPMDRFFARLHPAKPVERNNYFFQVTEHPAPPAVAALQHGTLPLDHAPVLPDQTELTWSHTSNGPEASYDHSVKRIRRPAAGPAHIAMRTERQTLRRLPRSNAILFTIRTHLVDLPTLASEPGVPARLAHALREWPDSVKWYKGAAMFLDTTLAYLDQQAQKQREQGVSGESEADKEQARRMYPH